MIYNSIYQPASDVGGVAGTSLIDLTSTSFAQMFANATNFSSSGNYIAGDMVYYQNAIWVCKLATTGGNPPPTLPTLRNNWWEFVGSQGTFTWIAYADSSTGFVNLAGVATTGTAGQFSCTSSTLVVGDIVTVTGTAGGTGSISGYTSGTNYLVSATNGTTTFTLTKADGTVLTTVAGTITGLTFTRYTLTNFTTGIPDTRKYMGIAANKNSATESTNPADYTWSRFVGTDGTVGISPIYASISRATVGVPTDSNGNNGVFTGSGTNIYIFEGQTALAFDGTGTNGSNGNSAGGTLASTWKIASRTATNVSITSAITDNGSFATVADITGITGDVGSVVYNISGTNSSGVAFSTSVTQTFTRIKGAIVDTAAPAIPTGLALTSSTPIITPAGDVQVKLSASWTPSADADISYYEVQIKEGAGNYISYSVPCNNDAATNAAPTSIGYEWFVKPNTSYTVQIRAIDKSDNRSAYCTAVSITSSKDINAPSPPTSVSSIAAIKNVFLSWSNDSATDLAFVEIWRHVADDTTSATKIATVNATYSTPGAFTDSSGVSYGSVYFYWLKSVDSSGNVSGFSTTSSSSVSGVAITGTSGQFSCASTTIKLGQVVKIIGTLGGTGSISGYVSTGSWYVISATNGSTTFTLVNPNGTPITTTAGTLTGLTYTKYASASVPAAVGTSDIVAGSIVADTIQANTLTGDKFNTTTNLPATITVGSSGVSIDTVRTNAATGVLDPVGRINGGTTTIDAGKILIAGTSSNPTATLASWQRTGDTTKIEGGKIATNSILASSIEVGVRGVDISGIEFQCSVDTAGAPTGTVTWTGGSITYTNDAGSIKVVPVDPGSAAFSSAMLYIYWTKPSDPNSVATTVLSASTASGTAYTSSTIVLATYAGGTNLVANYGRTIIDGSKITTGTVDANRLKADSIIGNKIFVGGNNFRINGAEKGTGKGTLTVGNGTYDSLVSLGYLDADNVGLWLRDSSGNTILKSVASAGTGASSTTYADAINNAKVEAPLGRWQWRVDRYDTTNAINPANTVPDYDIINKAVLGATNYVSNITTSFTFSADNYIGVASCTVYSASAWTWTVGVSHDDAGRIYVNGKSVYSNQIGSYTATLAIPAGWTTIELMWAEQGGGDAFSLAQGINARAEITDMWAGADTSKAILSASSAPTTNIYNATHGANFGTAPNLIPGYQTLAKATYTNGANLGTSTTTSPGYFANLVGADSSTVLWGTPISCTPGQVLYYSHRVKSDVSTVDACRAGYQGYNAAGSFVSSYDMPNSAFGGSESIGTFKEKTQTITVPAGIYFINPYVVRNGWSGNGTFIVGDPFLGTSTRNTVIPGTSNVSGIISPSNISTYIANLAVDTLQIADQAVSTISIYSSNQVGTTYPYTPNYTFSIPFTMAHDGDFFITISVFVYGAGSVWSQVVAEGGQTFYASGAPALGSRALLIKGSLPAGSYTRTVTCTGRTWNDGWNIYYDGGIYGYDLAATITRTYR